MQGFGMCQHLWFRVFDGSKGLKKTLSGNGHCESDCRRSIAIATVISVGVRPAAVITSVTIWIQAFSNALNPRYSTP